MWKRANRVTLCRLNKLGYMNVKEYWVISLLNFLGQVCKKVVTDMLTEWCKVNHVIHGGQIGSRRQRRAIDVVARVGSTVQKA